MNSWFVTLGILGHGASIFGLLHGLNALALATAALYTQSLAGRGAVTRSADAEQSRIHA